MAKSGYDAVVIPGASKEPLWIENSDQVATFYPARDLWILDTYETEDPVQQRLSENNPEQRKSAVMVIGPARENRVTYAVVENDNWRSAGRTGTGAVMGSKRIKTISFSGSRKKEVTDEEILKEFNRRFAAIGKDNPGVHGEALETGKIISHADMMALLDDYYQTRGRG